MSSIVTTHYRYKRPPKKKRKTPAVKELPTIIARGTKAQRSPASDQREPAIVIARRASEASAPAPDLTSEEHRRRGDLADALFRELVRRAGDSDQ